MPSLPYYDHILLHRLWAFATLQDDLGVPEHTHLLDCEECRASLRVCMNAENFGAVLKKIRPSDSSESNIDVRTAPSVPSSSTPSEVRTTIEGLLGLAGKKELEEGFDGKALEVQICATLALGFFMPDEQARRGLIALMASEDVSTKIRSAASEAINRGTDDVSDEPL